MSLEARILAVIQAIAADIKALVDGKANRAQAINPVTATAYTLAASDAGKLVTLSNAAAVTCTIPPNGTVPIPVGESVDAAQMGAGQVTFAPGSGVTLRATPGLKLRAQYSAASLVKVAENEWLVVGDLSA